MVAAKYQGNALVYKLLSGPDHLVHNPITVCFLFQEQIALSADLKAMFLQITQLQQIARLRARTDCFGKKNPEQ